jgi:small subunit ribosomal protein S14
MKALIKKNKLIRSKYQTTELNSYINSALNKNNLLEPTIKDILNSTKLEIGPISKIRNICVITGRARAVIQKYKMSRIKFKQNAEAGLIPGIKKL